MFWNSFVHIWKIADYRDGPIILFDLICEISLKIQSIEEKSNSDLIF